MNELQEKMPERIWAGQSYHDDLDWYEPYWSERTTPEDIERFGEVEYIRADIVAVKDDNFRDLAYQRGAALAEILECITPCNCHEAYIRRGLIAPDCQYHSSGMEDVEAIVGRVLGE